MTTLLPTSQSTGVETYEDMFKEITRKLYGDESAHGLYPHNTQVAQVAQLAPGAPTGPPPDGGERSFTTLTQIGYETTTVGGANQPSSSTSQQQQQQQQQQEQITTAFGLAALMQNGFPPPGTMLNPVNFPGASKTPTNISIPSTEDRWPSQQQATEEPWNGGKHAAPSTYGGGGAKSYKKPKTEPQDSTASPTGLNIPSTVDRANKSGSYGGTATSPTGSTNVIKRYSCTSCPYTTDRRDLFTRHENIHKDEKPFQCYACLKPFNRADHVKKHFLRMHRELEYDIAKTRRHPPGGGGGGSSGGKSAYYAGNSQPSATVPSAASSSSSSSSSTTAAMSLAQMQLNIPSGSFSTAPSLIVPTHTLEGGSSSGAHLNGSHSAQLLQLQTHHHQQQQQQHHHQHANLHPQSQLASVAIKQEKGTSVPGSLNTSTASSSGSPDEKGGYAKKIKGEKKFACTYCPWAGADNWGLKRHLNTHTKPYVCLLCDYKAARSERLATHVLKVHNKKACSKCNFFAEDQAHLDAHLQEAHSHDASKAAGKGGSSGVGTTGSSSHSSTSAPHHHPGMAGNDTTNGNVLRNLGNAFTSNNLPTNIPTSGNGFGNGTSNGQYHTANVHQPTTGNVLTNSNAANLIETINQHVLASSSVGQNGGGAGSSQQHQWIATRPHRKRGPDLLYSYLEADGSDSGDYARLLHMQAVGRNKASVTQDFRNAGGGDNGDDAGDSATSSPYDALSMAAVAAIERQMKKKHHSVQDGKNHGATSQSDSVNLSLASLFGGDQLSFLQLLATAAVAHQQLQLHSNQQQQQQQQPYLQHHHQQQKKQQQPKPSKAVDHHPVGASNGGRYGGSTMVSSPPATSTQQQPRTSSTSTTSNSTNGTAGSGTSGPFIDPQYQQLQPLALDMGSMKKRRTTANNESSSSSSSDKENHVQRNRINGGGGNGTIVSQQSNGGTAAAVVGIGTANGGSAINGGIIDKHNPTHKNGHTLHHHHHHPHHHNNNNSSTSNKNINDIFDKVYKKPQNSFNAAKQPQPVTTAAAHTTLATILRTAPPSAVEEDNRRDALAEQFSLTEFLKSHTEVSISTVGGGKGTEVGSPVTIIPLPPVADRQQDTKENGTPSAEGERNGRKRYQPRRVDEGDDLVPSSTDPLSFVSVELLDASIEAKEEPRKEPEESHAIDLKVQKQSTIPTEKEPKPSAAVNRMADIRDKHMIKLISNRRCCRICRSKGLLDHLDNAHYHSKMSLFLHTLWRHRSRTVEEPVQCRNCDAKFTRRYMLMLHQKLTKHTGEGLRTDPKTHSPDCTNGKKSNGKRQQRKSKPRSRWFTVKRKK